MNNNLPILNIVVGCFILGGLSSCEVNSVDGGLDIGYCKAVVTTTCFHSVRINLVHSPDEIIENIESQDDSKVFIFSKSFVKEKAENSCPPFSNTYPFDNCEQDKTHGKTIVKSRTENGSLVEIKVSNLISTFKRLSDFDIMVTTNKKIYKKHFQPKIEDVKYDVQDHCTGEPYEAVCKSTEVTFELN